MLSQGLSHVVFNASNFDDYKNTLRFYQAIGFKPVTDKPNNESYEERTAWLKLASGAQATADIIIKLVLNASALAQHKPSADVDWSLEESAIVFNTNDIKVSFFFIIDKIDKEARTKKKNSLTDWVFILGCQVKIGRVGCCSTRS
jgi:hypothetical protein